MLAGVKSSVPVSVSDFDVPVLTDFETTEETGMGHEYGTLSFARDLLETGDVIPEFVICLRDSPEMDYAGRNWPDMRGFPAFGKVIQGMDVARKIAAGDRSGTTYIEFLKGQILSDPVIITRAYRLQSAVVPSLQVPSKE